MALDPLTRGSEGHIRPESREGDRGSVQHVVVVRGAKGVGSRAATVHAVLTEDSRLLLREREADAATGLAVSRLFSRMRDHCSCSSAAPPVLLSSCSDRRRSFHTHAAFTMETETIDWANRLTGARRRVTRADQTPQTRGPDAGTQGRSALDRCSSLPVQVAAVESAVGCSSS